MAQTLEIGVELSLYPLDANFIPPIQDFIDRLHLDGRFKVVTNSLSTQVFGSYDDVMGALTRELRKTFESNAKAVFVLKIIGPLAAA
jgi:hypothetical protein